MKFTEIGNAGYAPNARGGYDVLARYNDRGKFRVIESLIAFDQTQLFIQQLNADDKLRHECLRETKGWDFVTNDVAVKRVRQPREPREPKLPPVNFSFED